MTDPENITKIHAAERQLRVAIGLFFQRSDPVAIQTLTSAASSILHDLGSQQGIASPIRDSDLIRPERKREWIDALNRAPNFFKHADRDPDEILEFHRDGVEWSILEAVDMFGRLTGKFVAETLIFSSWFYIRYPDLVTNERMKTALGRITNPLPNTEDFDLFLEMLHANQDLESSGEWPPKAPSAQQG